MPPPPFAAAGGNIFSRVVAFRGMFTAPLPPLARSLALRQQALCAHRSPHRALHRAVAAHIAAAWPACLRVRAAARLHRHTFALCALLPHTRRFPRHSPAAAPLTLQQHIISGIGDSDNGINGENGGIGGSGNNRGKAANGEMKINQHRRRASSSAVASMAA
jgi:hypothetical protein